MLNIVGTSFTEIYTNAFEHIMLANNKCTVRNNEMFEVIPAILTLTNPRDRLLSFNNMRNIKKYCYGEALWYLSGSNKLDFIAKYSSFWEHISDDGVTVNSAYGKYIFADTYRASNFKTISQWDNVKKILTHDPGSRQAVIHIKPIQIKDTLDTVCTLILQFFIRNNKLDMIVHMRSNDMYFGLTFDLFQFTLLQELMAAELGVELGKYIHITNNLHIYSHNINSLTKMIESGVKKSEILPKIPSDFRTNDLPCLLSMTNLDKLSNFGKEFIKYGE